MPIIVQTSMTSQEEVQSCLEAGAYYYLTKPFNAGILIAVVNTAIQDYHDYQQLQEETKHTSSVLSKITYARFNFQTPAEAREIATYIVKSCQEEHNVVLGLSELMLNAVEHGNLGITYQEKSQLLKEGLWHEEIYKRLIDPSNAKKNATVTFERDEFEIRFIIRDEGNGFDWRNYLEMKPERALDLHGRGIVLAGTISFDKLEYNEVGNEVIATIYCE
jgi:anti-sigma regulatory factor (Ser/Thr protein kinase)